MIRNNFSTLVYTCFSNLLNNSRNNITHVLTIVEHVVGSTGLFVNNHIK